MDKFALIGNQISYSLSPSIYNYWFKIYGIQARYSLLDIPCASFSKDFFQQEIQQKFTGCNITKPYKENLLQFTTKLNQVADEIKSINTLHFKGTQVIGYNTDYLGLLDSFSYYKLNFHNKNILILGAGGASKALIYALNSLKLSNKIVVYNRSAPKIEHTKKLFPNILNYDVLAKNEGFDFIFNATTVKVGDIFNIINITLKKDTIIYNLNYNNNEVMDKNVQMIDGMYMLLSQAVYNFKIWFNKKPPLNADLIKYFKDIKI